MSFFRFKHTKVPAGLWAEITEFFNTNRYKEVQEGWRIGDNYTNHYDVPSTIVHLTEVMRAKIWEGARPMLEDWSDVR